MKLLKKIMNYKFNKLKIREEDIFESNNIYPYDIKIKEHFKYYYDSVFIVFLSFFRIDYPEKTVRNFKKSKKMEYEEIIKDPIFKNITKEGKVFYSYDAENFPNEEEINEWGYPIFWDSIIKESKLNEKSELNRALKTSIGALRKEFSREDLMEKLNDYTIKNSIYHPVEGRFDIFSKIAMYKIFKLFNKNEIKIVEEFYQTEKTIHLDEVNEFEFSEEINGDDRYIYSIDKDILFTIDWDSFFFLIGTRSEKIMDKIISKNFFNGFLCDGETSHSWDYNLNGI